MHACNNVDHTFMTDVSPVASLQPASSSSVGSCHCRLYSSSHAMPSFSSPSTGAEVPGLFETASGLLGTVPELLEVLAGELFGEVEGVAGAEEDCDRAAALAAARPASSLAVAFGPPRRATRSLSKLWSWRTCSMTACTHKTKCCQPMYFQPQDLRDNVKSCYQSQSTCTESSGHCNAWAYTDWQCP